MRSPGFERPRKAVLHETFRTERQRDVSVGARMEIEHGSGLRPEIYNLVSLQDLQDYDLIFHQRG